ncbi:hypothetical protein Ahy_A06g027436 [Arachis hypogaea]|uniref:GRF-type domain-containing protein n=1 Tax=Arachis hypogaea TaxID=3818 RepID=A0A445CNM3_ARAHY|nr:hypothetical protein Ahy_A06g027436 [Arachis hypogaea]
MASEGVSSSSRRGPVPNGNDGKEGVSPGCFCGENAILFMSRTSSNPNRLFLGCPFYKTTMLQVFFLWLDEHVAGLGVGVTRYLGQEQILHGEEHLRMKDMENRILLSEKRIEALEVTWSCSLGDFLSCCFLHCARLLLNQWCRWPEDLLLWSEFDGFGREVLLTISRTLPGALHGGLYLGLVA